MSNTSKLPLRKMHTVLTTAAEAVKSPVAATFLAAGVDYLKQRSVEAIAANQLPLALTLLALALARQQDAAFQSNTTGSVGSGTPG